MTKRRRQIATIDRATRGVLRWLRQTRAPVAGDDTKLVGMAARHPAIDDAVGELRAFGVPTRFSFAWSDDGSGVEDDTPRTIHLHRSLVVADDLPPAVLARSDRICSLDLRSVVRHEIGHALIFLDPRATRTRAFRDRFGDVRKTYRVGSVVDEVVRRIERHGGLANPRYRRVVSLYAASHPHEAFAEAVRIALATGGDSVLVDAWVVDNDAHPVVGSQIRYAADWLAGYRTR
jgi:hypothetical protein